MKKIITILFVSASFLFLFQEAYSQESSVDSIFYQKCDSLVTAISDFEPSSGNEEYDLYIINNILPKTIDYILIIRESTKKAKEYGVEIDYEFMIDELIFDLEVIKDILKNKK